jgi:hypothetical protein
LGTASFKEDGPVGVLKTPRQFLRVLAMKEFALLGVAAVGRLEKLQKSCLGKTIDNEGNRLAYYTSKPGRRSSPTKIGSLILIHFDRR